MGLEACPKCGHLTHVYGDRVRQHHPGCSLAAPVQTAERLYEEIAPSGVHVYSCRPFVEPRWYDKPYLHWIWSYASWLSMIGKAQGLEWPRKIFKKYIDRPHRWETGK